MTMIEGSGASELTVLLADDHVPTRTGVRMALEGADLRVVGEVATAQNAVTEALRLRPDVCLLAMDWGWSMAATSQRLLEKSRKAQENGPAYARRTVEHAAAVLARRSTAENKLR